MGYGFRYVLGAVILIAVLFAGLSLVPTALNQWLRLSGPSQHAAQAPASGALATAPGADADSGTSGYTLPVPAPPQPPVKRTPGGVSNAPHKPGPTLSSGGSAPNGNPGAGGPGGNGPGGRAGSGGQPDLGGAGGWSGGQPGGPGAGVGSPGSPAQPSPGTAPASPGRNPLAGGPASPHPPAQSHKLGRAAPPEDGQGSTLIGWRTLRGNLILRKSPGGEGFQAPTASLEPLTIAKGSHVLAIRQDGVWMLVRSPARTLGWVEARELEPVASSLLPYFGM